MADRFNVGDTVTLTNTFKVAGVATQPTTASLAVTDPAGVTTTYTTAGATLTVTSGVGSKNITVDSAGTWRYVWTGTGAAADVQDGSFSVFPAADLTVYCTIDQLRDELGSYSSTDLSDDAKLQRAINAACRQIDGWCGQRFWRDAAVATREFHPDDSRLLYVEEGISTTTGLIVKIDDTGAGTYGTTLTLATDFLLRPENAADLSPAVPYTEVWAADNYSFPSLANGRPGVQITARFGWPTVPDDVVQAALIQASQLFKAKDAVFGVAAFGELGALRVRSSLNPLAAGLLAPYRRVAVG